MFPIKLMHIVHKFIQIKHKLYNTSPFLISYRILFMLNYKTGNIDMVGFISFHQIYLDLLKRYILIKEGEIFYFENMDY